jgi:ubiquinone/menaquinone biosynthesis C-methylase UbiE
MKMTAIEKALVNRPDHSRSVAHRRAGRIGRLPVQAGQRYLDVGCGNGASTIRVAGAFGLVATGVDVDPEQVRHAREAANGIPYVTFRVADAANLPFSEDSFDIVVTNKTTHHIPDWRKVLAEMARVLKPQGYLVYADLALPAWTAALMKPLVGRRAGVFTHRDLSRRFQELNLELVGRTTSWHDYDAVFRKAQEPT